MNAITRFLGLPAWARFSGAAAIGVLLLAGTQALESSDVGRLTSPTASQAMLRWSIPILLAGLGGLYAERAGVVNIGLEGMMVLGTWFGAWGTVHWGPWVGILIGLGGGAIGGLIHAVATVSFGVDHIISGVAINLLAPGVTRYLSDQIFSGYEGGSITQSPRVEGIGDFTMPVLAGGSFFGIDTPNMLGAIDDWNLFFVSDVAGLALGFISQVGLFTIAAVAIVPISAYLLWRTRFGLRLRIAGESPIAGESLGINIYTQKYIGVIISGALSGMAGAFIALELTGFYREGQTGGRGFIGLATLIFGNWQPVGILLAAMLFGYPFGIRLRDLDGTSTHALLLVVSITMLAPLIWAANRKKWADVAIAGFLSASMLLWYLMSDTAPDWLPGVMPYTIVLLALIFASQRLRMPAADGLPYHRGEQ